MHVQSFSGSAAHPYISDLARLRISVFREFPYLYDGSPASEEDYLRTYFDTQDCVIVVAFDGGRIVGASTGMPLAHETENIWKPWKERGFEVEQIFYYGESVLERNYRGRGIGVRFFEKREHWARSLNRFEYAAFCAVVRPGDHPLRPDHYRPLDEFWQKRGFVKTEDITCFISWKDLDEPHQTEKPLHFWWKKISD